MNQATNPHPQAEMLKAAAENANTMFQFLHTPVGQDSNGDVLVWSDTYYPIEDVIRHPRRKWRVAKEPRVETEYYSLTGKMLGRFTRPPDLEHWDLKLTFTDGKLTGAEVAK